MLRTVLAVAYPSDNSSYCKVRLDDGTTLSIPTGAAAQKGLRAGLPLSEDEFELLSSLSALEKAKAAALRYLRYRPRSEAEVRLKLKRLGVAEDVIAHVVDFLREKDLINDRSFAQFWKENRLTLRPRSRFFVRHELVQKGVDPQVIEEEVGDIDDQAVAYLAAQKKLRSIHTQDYEGFRNKLSSFLRRRGFRHSVTAATVERLWAER